MKKKEAEEFIKELDDIINSSDDNFAVDQAKKIKSKLINKFNDSLPEEGFHFRDDNIEDSIEEDDEDEGGFGLSSY